MPEQQGVLLFSLQMGAHPKHLNCSGAVQDPAEVRHVLKQTPAMTRCVPKQKGTWPRKLGLFVGPGACTCAAALAHLHLTRTFFPSLSFKITSIMLGPG